MSGWAEHQVGIWRLRAVLCPDSPVVGMEGYEDGSRVDLWVWFVGRDDADEWFAHGLSDSYEASDAERVAATIDGWQLDILLAYGGMPWDDVITTPTHYAQLQRNMANMSEEEFTELSALSTPEIRTLRGAEEASFEQRFSSN